MLASLIVLVPAAPIWTTAFVLGYVRLAGGLRFIISAILASLAAICSLVSGEPSKFLCGLTIGTSGEQIC